MAWETLRQIALTRTLLLMLAQQEPATSDWERPNASALAELDEWAAVVSRSWLFVFRIPTTIYNALFLCECYRHDMTSARLFLIRSLLSRAEPMIFPLTERLDKALQQLGWFEMRGSRVSDWSSADHSFAVVRVGRHFEGRVRSWWQMMTEMRRRVLA